MDRMSDERLMAYADGEGDAAERAAIERAIAADPALARRVAAHRALRERLHAAFDPVLAEPLPQRLLDATAGSAPVIDLAAERGRRRWQPMHWGALAASLCVGLLIGRLWQPAARDAALAWIGDAAVAAGPLAAVLETAPSGPEGAARLSFVDRAGRYCRGFALGAQAGLACRAAEGWRIEALAATEAHEAGASGPAYRQAGSALPPAVLAAIDARIAGPALDATAERAAIAAGWQRTR